MSVRKEPRQRAEQADRGRREKTARLIGKAFGGPVASGCANRRCEMGVNDRGSNLTG